MAESSGRLVYLVLMHRIWVYTILMLSLFLIYTKGMSQSVNQTIDRIADSFNAQQSDTDKILVYLQTSKDIYLSGEDLWFSTLVLDARSFTLSQVDNTIYISLHSADNDSTVWKEMYPIKNGISSGHVYLPQTLSEGSYFLKAYTAHAATSDLHHAVSQVKILKDTKSIQNHRAKEPTTQEKKKPVQFNIFPEGGDLVAGQQNYISVKSVNRNGEPEDVSGVLLRDGLPVAHFKTEYAGLGRLSFTPQIKALYEIKLDNYDSTYPLPKVKETGILLHLLKSENDTLTFTVRSSQVVKGKRIFIRLQTRGMIQAIAAATISDSIEVRIPVKNCPQGIAEATLFDEFLQPLAERLVYLHPERRLSIQTSNLSNAYLAKGKVSLSVKTTDHAGNPIPSVLNIRVFDQLFYDSNKTNNILSYFYLTTQLRGNIYNPSYYFDTSNKKRNEHLDLLLTTQGWRRYTWNENNYSKRINDGSDAFVSDSIAASVDPVGRTKDVKYPMTVMLFNYNKSKTQVSVTDSAGKFYLTPEDLSMAPRIFIKYFSDKDYRVRVDDPFVRISDHEKKTGTKYPLFYKLTENNNDTSPDSSDLLQYGKMLETVIVTSKARGFNDKYLGHLDSLAKYEDNTDFVGSCGWLNCPACGNGTKPVEGNIYSELTESKKNQVSSHPFSFQSNEMRKVAYHYPKYTEEELLSKFKMTVTKGYYSTREFYQPDYDKESNENIDLRSTLLWKPEVITNQKGEATVTFFCSDIKARFIGFIEGVADDGLLGVQTISFSVR